MIALGRRRQPALVPFPRCPRCGKPLQGYLPRRGDGFPTCQAKRPGGERCGAKWWFMMLVPGLVEEQLAETFGDRVAAELMADHDFPIAIAEPMAWQLEVTPHEAHVHRTSTAAALARGLGLVHPAG